jgi:tetratricopeptide (TPR) repeat protein
VKAVVPHTIRSAIIAATAAACLWGAPDGLEDREQLYQHATALLKNGEFDRAALEYQKLVARWPDFFPAFSLLGVAYTELGKPEEAGTYFLKAVKLAPNSAEARINLGVNYQARKKLAQAAAEFERATVLDPSKESAWFNLGMANLQMSNAGKAVQALERAQALAPGDPQIALAVAEARLRAQQTDAALEGLRSLDKQSRGDPEVLVTIGVLLQRNGRGPEASQYFQRVAKPGPAAEPLIWETAHKSANEGDYQSAWSLLMLLSHSRGDSAEWNEFAGYTAFQLNLIEPAMEYLQKAIRLNPSNEDCYLELGEVLGQNNAIPAVVAIFEAASRRMPNSLKIASGLGVAYVMLRDYDQAERILRKLVESRPDYEVGYKLLAECYERAQNWGSLRALAEQWRRLDAKNNLGWYYGAKTEYMLRLPKGENLELVHQYLAKAMKLNPGDWKAPFLLGKTLVAEHRDREAAAALTLAVGLKPEDPAAHYLLARTLQRLGQVEQSKAALAAYKEAQTNKKVRELRTLLVQIK